MVDWQPEIRDTLCGDHIGTICTICGTEKCTCKLGVIPQPGMIGGILPYDSPHPHIIYQNFELKDNERHVANIVNHYSWLFPSWLHALTVAIYDEHSDAPEGTIAWASARPEYGTATIYILSRWLDRPEKNQRSFILHEILHIAQRREYNFVWDRLLNPMQNKNEELHAFLVEDYRERNEEFIEGLTRGIISDGKR